ncbi:MAG: hypothetical protein HC869_23645 [Rhodospirillales bacterium]|nr:hypothetical protein [Rhodospirillales bacterium]
MDQEQLRRFTDVYRQMRDEQLAALLGEQGTLTDEARQALLAVVAERPDVPGIQRQEREEARRQSGQQAEREATEARRDVQLAGARPAIGFWLGLLAVILCAWAVWRSLTLCWAIWVMDPLGVEAGAFLAFRVVIIATAASILVAAGVAIHAILAGKARRHLRRIVAMLWYIAVGAFLISSRPYGCCFAPSTSGRSSALRRL